MQPELTFIHGFMGQPSDWDRIRDGLSRFTEFKTNAVEVKPAETWAVSLKCLAEEIPQGSFLVGYSMGARIALGLTIEFPQRYRGLVFVAGNPGLESEHVRQDRLISDRQLVDQIRQLNDHQSCEQFLQQWYQQSVFSSLPEAIRAEEVRRKSARDSTEWAAVLGAHSVSCQPNYWPKLSGLAVPGCVVAGDVDEKYREIAVRMGEMNPRFETHVVADCGHMVHREQTSELIEIIARFVTSLL